MRTSDIVILVACHKKCNVPEDAMYLPVHVGAAGKEDIGFQRDDEGENISEKNPLYCELTGIYWGWKNLKYDYLGVSHYRRYFTDRRIRIGKDQLSAVLSKEELLKYLAKYKVIVPKKRHYYIETVYDHYSHTFSEEQLQAARAVLSAAYPEYLESWDKVMNARSLYLFNMFIMNAELADSYLTWLFDVLDKLEDKIDTSDMSSFEKRYIGRVSERLFNAWLDRQIKTGQLKANDIYELPYIYIGKIDWVRKVKSFLEAKFFHKKYERSF